MMIYIFERSVLASVHTHHQGRTGNGQVNVIAGISEITDGEPEVPDLARKNQDYLQPDTLF